MNNYIFMLTILNWLCDHSEYIDIIPQVCGIPCPSFTLRSTRVLWSVPHHSAEILEADWRYGWRFFAHAYILQIAWEMVLEGYPFPSFPILSLSLRNEQRVIVLPQFLEKPVPQEAFAGKWAGQVKQSMKRLTKVLPVGRDGGDMVVARTLCSRLSINLLSCGDSATRGSKSNVNRLHTLTVFGIRQRPSD